MDLRIEDKELDLVFEVVNVRFNQVGEYQLVLTIENLLVGSDFRVHLRLEDGDVLKKGSVCTDTIAQDSLDEVYSLHATSLSLLYPKPF